jgi:hypothetical protein
MDVKIFLSYKWKKNQWSLSQHYNNCLFYVLFLLIMSWALCFDILFRSKILSHQFVYVSTFRSVRSGIARAYVPYTRDLRSPFVLWEIFFKAFLLLGFIAQYVQYNRLCFVRKEAKSQYSCLLTKSSMIHFGFNMIYFLQKKKRRALCCDNSFLLRYEINLSKKFGI